MEKFNKRDADIFNASIAAIDSADIRKPYPEDPKPPTYPAKEGDTFDISACIIFSWYVDALDLELSVKVIDVMDYPDEIAAKCKHIESQVEGLHIGRVLG